MHRAMRDMHMYMCVWVLVQERWLCLMEDVCVGIFAVRVSHVLIDSKRCTRNAHIDQKHADFIYENAPDGEFCEATKRTLQTEPK